MESPTGPVRLRAEFTPEIINLKWYDEDGNRVTVPTTSNSCTYDTSISLPPNPTKTGYKFKGWKVMPDTAIEYIESTGTQWIDTGIKFTSENVKAEITASYNSTCASRGMFGAQNAQYTNSAIVFYNNNLYIGNSYNPGVQVFSSNKATITVTASNGVYSLKIYNGNTITENFSGSVISNSSWLIGNMHLGSNVPYVGCSGKFYSVKLWNNGTLVRDMVPIKDEDGVPCMYDFVTKQKFYNAGTGNFIAGPEI